MTNEQLNTTDERWGGYIPWFLRHQDFSATGNFEVFFSRLSQRLERLFRFNEPGVNLLHYGALLESESLQRFREDKSVYPKPVPLNKQIEVFFTSYMISADAIIAEIRKSLFMVADFTENRGGVYFEAGYAQGLGIPVIWTCRHDHKDRLHFDTRQYNHILWTDEIDLFEQLRRRIEATIPVE